MLRKSGDTGYSDLFSSQRISKSSLPIAVLGDLDELGSALGVARSYIKNQMIHDEIILIQRSLFVVGAEIATEKDEYHRLSKRIDDTFLNAFENKVAKRHQETTLPKDFIVAGDSKESAHLHLARSIARRCERSIVALNESNPLENKNLLAYINRLSVYLYLLALSFDDSPLGKD